MRNALSFSLILMSASPALAAGPFDATWKSDPAATQYDQRPEFLLLKDGIYECAACTPPLRIPADGQPHATTGRDVADAMSATVLDARSMRVASYKSGRKYSEFTRTLSADGNVMTTVTRSLPAGASEWKTSVSRLRRVGPAPAGAFAQSGYWLPVADDSRGTIVFTLRVQRGSIAMRDADGSSYEARFDGRPVPIAGDPAATVSLRRLGKRLFEETNYVRGRMTAVNLYTLVDSDTLTIDSRNVRSGFTDRYILHRR